MEYKGYKIIDVTERYPKYDSKSYQIPGCVWLFGSLEALKKYVDANRIIYPTEKGSMRYGRKIIRFRTKIKTKPNSLIRETEELSKEADYEMIGEDSFFTENIGNK